MSAGVPSDFHNRPLDGFIPSRSHLIDLLRSVMGLSQEIGGVTHSSFTLQRLANLMGNSNDSLDVLLSQLARRREPNTRVTLGPVVSLLNYCVEPHRMAAADAATLRIRGDSVLNLTLRNVGVVGRTSVLPVVMPPHLSKLVCIKPCVEILSSNNVVPEVSWNFPGYPCEVLSSYDLIRPTSGACNVTVVGNATSEYRIAGEWRECSSDAWRIDSLPMLHVGIHSCMISGLSALLLRCNKEKFASVAQFIINSWELESAFLGRMPGAEPLGGNFVFTNDQMTMLLRLVCLPHFCVIFLS